MVFHLNPALQANLPAGVPCIDGGGHSVGGGLPFRQIQFVHLNQSGEEHLICYLSDRHASPLGHGQKGSLYYKKNIMNKNIP